MKTKNKILVGVAAVVAAGLVVYTIRRKNTHYILSRVADEGYETAHDIIFPRKGKRDRRLRYGPVLPE